MARIDTLGNFLTDVADAIREKTGSEETIQASEFDTAISEIPSGLDWSALGYSDTPQSIIDGYNYAKEIKDNWDDTITTMQSMYENNKSLMFFPNVDVSLVTSYYQAFRYCINLKEISLSMSNNVASLSNVFSYCSSLTKVVLSGVMKSSGSLAGLFYGCSSLINVDLKNLDVSNVIMFSEVFTNCNSLEDLDLSNFVLYGGGNVTTMSMFNGCTSLKKLDLRNIDFSKIGTKTSMFGTSAGGVPDNCLIIVADQTQKDWMNTNFSRLTNVQTVAEYEASLSE